MSDEYYSPEDVEEALHPNVKVLSNRIRTSRRFRDCASECRERGISPGQRYREVVMIVDGKFEIVNECEHACDHLRKVARHHPAPTLASFSENESAF